MRFRTKAERQNHPQASLIPDSLWKDSYVFNNELPDDLLLLMQVEEQALLTQLQNSVVPQSEQYKKCTWLAIVLSHPQLSFEALQLIKKQLVITDELEFECAAAWGNLNYIKYLVNLYEPKSEWNYLNFFSYLIPSGLKAWIYLNYFNYFINPLGQQSSLQKMISADNYYAFRWAAQNGHIEVLRYLEEKAPDKLQAMIAASDYFTFKWASAREHLEVLRCQIQEMIAADDYHAFILAAANGHLEILRYLEEKAPDKLQAMIAASDYHAFRSAVENGHFEVLRYLETKAPDKLQEMIAADSYSAFCFAASNGHLGVLRYFEEKAPDKLQAMIVARDYWAFKWASANGHLEVLRYLEVKAPGRLQAMIAADDYHAFILAAANGHLEVLLYLEEKTPDKLQAMIAARDYWAFTSAATNGYLEILRYLGEKAPAKLQEIIAADDYYAFRWAAANGHLEVLLYLEEKVPNKLQEMIAASNYYAFRMAAYNKHTQVVNHLLTYANVFAYAELHEYEYGEQYIKPFIAESLRSLRAQKQELEQQQPNAIFDIDSLEQTKLLFYVLRHLIRRNDPALRDDILFLLEIPRVKNMVHTAVTPRRSNELLRLALSVGNQTAAELLLNLPEVRRLAEANNYYRHEVQGGLDLGQLAQDRESSMTALSVGEQQRLDAAIKKYTPSIEAKGIAQCMHDLRQQLTSLYQQHPTVITQVGPDKVEKKISLPLTWQEFQKLELKEPYYTQALQAYYQNKYHSAWRYLLKPNPWMHEHAAYVYMNEQNTQEKWSTFEEYQSLISLLHLAASDAQTPASEEYTLATRMEHFIEELALIGRAHNWDQTRVKIDAEGNPVLDDAGNVISEEYDDLEGDRPSCYSGVKRRLFQAVQGHPLLVFLSKEKVQSELNEFVRNHFQIAINKNNREAIKAAWDKLFEGYELAKEDWAVLQQVDITAAQQKQFTELLTQKYGAQFSSEPQFTKMIDDAFQHHPTQPAHMIKFSYVQPAQFLSAEEPVKTEGVGANSQGFFPQPQKQEENEPEANPTYQHS